VIARVARRSAQPTTAKERRWFSLHISNKREGGGSTVGDQCLSSTERRGNNQPSFGLFGWVESTGLGFIRHVGGVEGRRNPVMMKRFRGSRCAAEGGC